MKLLIVEDEMELANFLIRSLKREGYEVVHMADGKGVVKHLKKHLYDVIILDLMLPTVEGEKILKTIRGKRDTMPIIVLTALGDIPTKTRILNMGADDYLVKPFSFVELTARIKSVLRRTRGGVQQSEKLAVGDLVLDPDMRLLTRSGKPIKLRLKEYELMAFFMQNANRVVDRNTLIEKVWDYNAQLYSNTVDSHISSLRLKLNKGFDEKLIETVHGVGYLLRAHPGEAIIED